jgi:hypothetical protein
MGRGEKSDSEVGEGMVDVMEEAGSGAPRWRWHDRRLAGWEGKTSLRLKINNRHVKIGNWEDMIRG